ncbi:hypothetical protein IVB69_09950 [Flavobacterium sp. J49]|uniref:hypothetical protein n=1 Tax=Flavobacterium sp. J49 TaxID=2718534 RepID=UPI0015931B17|nr:hypothetical protein [Flavobacterium sp. J49]MBF6641800.1 hypothetical protein [Flavobacterium sp. J49]NIC03047.1 hypothetical protein [Flavobacterium sp. J49]
MQTDNQEIQRSVVTTNDVILQKFYENQNSRTTSSLDCYNSEMLLLNFKPQPKTHVYFDSIKGISNQTEFFKVSLPEFFNTNKSKINDLYSMLKQNKNLTNSTDKIFNLLCNYISELRFNDVHLEFTKSELLKITTIFNNNKMLIVSKDIKDSDTDIIYSYFIDRKLIASDVAEIKEFTGKFKEYLSL